MLRANIEGAGPGQDLQGVVSDCRSMTSQENTRIFSFGCVSEDVPSVVGHYIYVSQRPSNAIRSCLTLLPRTSAGCSDCRLLRLVDLSSTEGSSRVVARPRHKAGECAFVNAAATIWNASPTIVTSKTTIQLSKAALKTHLFISTYTD